MRPAYTNGTDRWLTPPDLIEALGPFSLDPCCEPRMPWRTAVRMVALVTAPDHFTVTEKPEFVSADALGDGLQEKWEGRVWMNHPYSSGLLWAQKMAAHNNGIALTAAKSTDTRWGQLMLAHCSLALFLAGRILFYYPDGTCSKGKWLPNVLWAFGKENAEILSRLTALTDYRGIYMKRVA